MHEIISTHVGQCGIQIGEAYWDQLASQYGIGKDGYQIKEMEYVAEQNNEANNIHACFHETSTGKFVPRAIFADLDPTPIEQLLLKNQNFDLFQVVTGKEDGCFFSRGYYTLGKEIIERILDAYR